MKKKTIPVTLSQEIWILHIQSESSENYYFAFSEEPNDKQITAAQKECFDSEGFHSDNEFKEAWKDLVSVRGVVKRGLM